MTKTYLEMTEQERFAMLEEKSRREQEAYDQHEKQWKDLPQITQIILAGDYSNVPLADQAFADGADWLSIMWGGEPSLGSYSRVDWALTKVLEDRIPVLEFYRELPNLWAMSDPDDSDPRFLAMWRKAFALNGAGYIRDDKKKKLPSGNPLRIWRGQTNDDGQYGISWSLDVEVAKQFAHGAWHRVPVPGIVFTALVYRKHVMAYLTGRGEKEIIIDPRHAMQVKEQMRWVRKEK